MPDTYTIQIDNVPYQVQWTSSTPPTVDDFTQIVNAIRPTQQHRTTAYQVNRPQLPAGISDSDVAAYANQYLTEPVQRNDTVAGTLQRGAALNLGLLSGNFDALKNALTPETPPVNPGSIPYQLLQKIQNLPLDQREAALPAGLSPVGRAAILQKAYELNPKLNIPADVAVPSLAAQVGITPQQYQQVRKNKNNPNAPGISGTAKANLAQRQAEIKALQDPRSPGELGNVQGLAIPLDPNDNPQTPAQQAAGLPVATRQQILAQQGLPDRQPAPTYVGQLVDAITQTPGAYDTAANTPGTLSHLATRGLGLLEPENLAIMASLGPIGELGPAANLAVMGTFGAPALKDAFQTARGHNGQPGDIGSALGDLAAFGLPFALHGLPKAADSALLRSNLKAYYDGGKPLDLNTAAQLDALYNQPEGTFAQSPELAKQAAFEILYPKKAKIEAQKAAADYQNRANRGEFNPPDANPSHYETPATRQAVPFGATTGQELPFGARSPLPDIIQPPDAKSESNEGGNKPVVLPDGSEVVTFNPDLARTPAKPTNAPNAPTNVPQIGQADTDAPVMDHPVPDATRLAQPANIPAPTETASNPTNANQGMTYTPSNTPVPFHYAVVPADALRTSHTDSLSVNPNYDPGLQPRDRSRAASDAQIESIAQNLSFPRIADAPTTADGAPVIGPDLQVESGNGRALGIRRAIAKYPEQYAQYVADLKQNAAKFGLDPAQIDRTPNPVLVRVSDLNHATPEARQSFAREAGETPVAQMSAVETARNDSRALQDSGALSLYQPRAALTSGSNQPFVSQFLQHVPETERGPFLQADGSLSAQGAQRVRNAILSAAYDDSSTIERLIGDPDPDIKNVGRALENLAPRLARLKQAIQSGEAFPLDIADNLTDAANRLAHLRQVGRTAEEELQQVGMFGENIAPETGKLLAFLEAHLRSAKAITELGDYYLKNVEDLGNPQQPNLIGRALPTKGELLDAAERFFNERRAGGQGDLFETESSGGPGPETAGALRTDSGSPTTEAGTVQSNADAGTSAGPQNPALTRAYQSGMNRGAIEFSSELQRDLYDLGAKMQRAQSGTGTRGVSVENPAEGIKALRSRLLQQTGLSADEVNRQAQQTYADVKAQMQGLADGETRQVTEDATNPRSNSSVDTENRPQSQTPPKPARTTLADLAARLEAEATENLRKKGKVTSGIDPTDLPDYAKLAVSYFLKGVVKASDVYASLRERLPDLSVPDFRAIYQEAVKRYEALLPSLPEDAPRPEPLDYAGEKYIGSRNTETANFNQSDADTLHRLYQQNESLFDAQRRGVRSVETTQEAARQQGVLPQNWERSEPGTPFNAEQLVAIHQATEASRTRLRQAEDAYLRNPNEANRQAKVQAEEELTRRERVYQGAAPETGRGLKALSTLPQEGYDPVPAQRVKDLFEPKPEPKAKAREATNPRTVNLPKVSLNVQEQARVGQLTQRILSKLSGKLSSGLIGPQFLEVLPELTELGSIYFKAGLRGFKEWKAQMRQHAPLSDSQAQEVFQRVSGQKATEAPARLDPTTPGIFAKGEGSRDFQGGNTRQIGNGLTEGTGEAATPGTGKPAGMQGRLTDLTETTTATEKPVPKVGMQGALPGTTETTTSEFQRTGSGRAGMQGTLEGTVPELSSNPDAQPSVRVGDQLPLSADRFISDSEYQAALQRLSDLRNRLPDQPAQSEIQNAARDIQTQSALKQLGLYHLEEVAQAIKDGSLDPKAQRSEWNQRMRADAGDLATKGLLNDVWNSLRDEAEVRAGVRGQAKDLLRRELIQHLSGGDVDGLAQRLASLDESAPDYYDQLETIARDYEKKTGWQSYANALIAFRRANILSSPRTLSKVLVSHHIFLGAEELARLPAALSDAIIGSKSGRRTVTAPNLTDIVDAARQAVQRGLPEAGQILRYGEKGAERRGMQQIGAGSNEVWGNVVTRSRLIDLYANAISRLHGAVYRPIKIYALARSLSEQARTIATNEGLSGTEYTGRVKALIDNPTPEMSAQAVSDAEFASFLNENGFHKGLNQLRSTHPGVQVAADLLFPVKKVPSNLSLRTWEYATGWAQAFRLLSPEFRAKLASDGVTQKQFSLTFGRGVTGLGIMAMGALAASYGLAGGVGNKKKRGAVTVGSRDYELNAIAPIGTLFNTGATLHDWQTEKKPAYFTDSLELASEQPLVRTGEQFFNPHDASGSNLVGNQFGTLLPGSQALSDLAAQMDEHPRKTKAGGFLPEVGNVVKKKVPGLRQTLPARPGEETNKLFDPFNSRPAQGH